MFPPTDLLIVVIVVLVGTGGFGLGRLSVISPHKAPVSVVENAVSVSEQAAVANAVNPSSGQVVASVSGSKYHLLSCPGAKQISEGNKIFFSSPEEARAAGYTPASNCPGLK